MTWYIVAIGKLKKGAEYDLCQTYISRTKTPIKIIELDTKSTQNASQQKEDEADIILKTIPPCATVIALDERGKNMSSPDFAKRIESIHTQGVSDIYFVIGGAFGLSERVRNMATLIMSFGQMTLPHMLVRSILCEQLYRVRTILDRHPYHKV